MINKSVFENELIVGMQSELLKQASDGTPPLSKAAECLHSALEIFESSGMKNRADQILQVLQKIAQHAKQKTVYDMPSISKLMEAGMTRRDLHEFSKGSPIAKAKLNLVLRNMGVSEHQLSKFLGAHNVMSEQDAKAILDPSSAAGKIWEWIKDPTLPTDPTNVQPGETIQFESKAQKYKTPNPEHISDMHTKGLSPEKQVKNILDHGTQFNMADDNTATVDATYENMLKRKQLTKDDMDIDFADLLDSPTFDIDSSDDELMGIEIKEDSLEVFDKEVPLEDFEDEKDVGDVRHKKHQSPAEEIQKLLEHQAEINKYFIERSKDPDSKETAEQAQKVYNRRPF